MNENKKIGVIIPALDEEHSIGKVIKDIPDWVDQIVVVDNGSADATARVARQNGAIVLYEPEIGYGAACLAGLSRLDDIDIVVFLDGDYSDYPEEMTEIVAPILSGRYSFVIGSRVLGRQQDGALSPQQRWGNRLACSLMRAIWGAEYSDLGPFRAIDFDTLKKFSMKDRTYGWTIEMQIKAALSDTRTCEVPVSYRQRIGVSKISGTIKGTVLAGLKILGLIWQYAWKEGITPQAARKQ